jgi:hypothetical protein
MNTHIKVQTTNGEELAFSRNPSGSIDVSVVTHKKTRFGYPTLRPDQKVSSIDAKESSKLATFFAQLV